MTHTAEITTFSSNLSKKTDDFQGTPTSFRLVSVDVMEKKSYGKKKDNPSTICRGTDFFTSPKKKRASGIIQSLSNREYAAGKTKIPHNSKFE